MKRNWYMLVLLLLILIFVNIPRTLQKKTAEEYFSSTSVPDEVWDHYFQIRREMQGEQPISRQQPVQQLLRQVDERAYFFYAIASLATVDTGFASEAKERMSEIIAEMREIHSALSGRTLPESEAIVGLHRALMEALFSGSGIRESFKKEPDLQDYSLGRALQLLTLQLDTSQTDVPLQYQLPDPETIRISSDIDSAWDQFAEWFKPLPFFRPVLPTKTDTLYARLSRRFFHWLEKQSPKALRERPFWPQERALVFALAAAHECGDRKGFSRLLPKCRIYGKLRYQGLYQRYENADLFGQTALLFARVCRMTRVIQQRGERTRK